MIDHSVKAVNFYLSINYTTHYLGLFCHHGMTQLWFTSVNKVDSCESIVLIVGRRGGGSFSSVAKLGNKTWWKVMKCCTESRNRTDTGGWSFTRFRSLPSIIGTNKSSRLGKAGTGSTHKSDAKLVDICQGNM